MTKKVIVTILALCIVAVAVPAFAQSAIRLKAVGAKVGYVKPENIDGTFGFGAIADLGTIIPQLGWEAEVTYWSKSYDEVGGSVSMHDIAILTSGKYFFPVPQSKFSPYIGGGIGLHMFGSKVEWDSGWYGSGSTSDTDTKFGFHFLGGAEMELSPLLNGFAEFRYSLVSDVNQLWIMAGVKYNLGM